VLSSASKTESFLGISVLAFFCVCVCLCVCYIDALYKHIYVCFKYILYINIHMF
jgi:hypothetical protein